MGKPVGDEVMNDRLFKVGVVVIAGSLAFIGWMEFFGPVRECPECSPFAHWVVESLRERPEEWREDPYYLTHRKVELAFWIANGASFMQPYPLESSNPYQWDANACCASREQRYVWTAYRAWHDQTDKPLALYRFRLREQEE